MDTNCVININPERSFIDQSVDITLTGLQQNQKVIIRAVSNDYYCVNSGMPEQGQNSVWESYGIFIADDNGNLSLGKAAPVEGTYQICDAMGLFYSMKIRELCPGTLTKELSKVSENRSFHILFTVEANGEILASKEHTRQFCDETIKSETIVQKGLIARYFTSDFLKKRPAVIVVSGSDGRIEIAQAIAEVLAQRGYCALAICYFGMNGTLPNLSQIPLEIIGNAIEWLKKQESVDEKRIGIYGRSKGGELVLAAASIFPDITCVIANTPSCYVYEGLKDKITSRHSSWTYGGKELPFLKFSNSILFQMIIKKMLGQKDLIQWMYQQLITRGETDKASIAVEKINGPILFFSSESDSIWPSLLHCETAVHRLDEKKFQHPYKHCTYEKAGHMLTLPYQSIANLKRWNVSLEEWKQACLESWRQTTDFLDNWSHNI
ncbi:acyl-CoA thioesterase/bile acid-CoA:amino acid N-acyltransferase family protein [Clostridium sp. E02]|uniref:acyl-CoA thioesterase/bile acid-CoA:amino acid N-acyltransferase family protein n=1 Tax=Clostridium sp. E02 TaxID=2487134 RepID=UPI000F536BCE|nr:acyl-CoA thioesterase/bile acid-CoA:amino acid N-acyltransferase family protein [Clostridium sp. E02]